MVVVGYKYQFAKYMYKQHRKAAKAAKAVITQNPLQRVPHTELPIYNQPAQQSMPNVFIHTPTKKEFAPMQSRPRLLSSRSMPVVEIV